MTTSKIQSAIAPTRPTFSHLETEELLGIILTSGHHRTEHLVQKLVTETDRPDVYARLLDRVRASITLNADDTTPAPVARRRRTAAPSAAERLIARLRQAGINLPIGSRCVRNRVTGEQINEGAWRWLVDGPNGVPVGIGSWHTMTEMLRAKTWIIDTNEFGETTIAPLQGKGIDPAQQASRKQRVHTFTEGKGGASA